MLATACRYEGRTQLLHPWGAGGLLLLLLLLIPLWQLYSATTRTPFPIVPDLTSAPLSASPDFNTRQIASPVRFAADKQACTVPSASTSTSIGATNPFTLVGAATRYELTPEAIPPWPRTGGPGGRIGEEEKHDVQNK